MPKKRVNSYSADEALYNMQQRLQSINSSIEAFENCVAGLYESMRTVSAHIAFVESIATAQLAGDPLPVCDDDLTAPPRSLN